MKSPLLLVLAKQETRFDLGKPGIIIVRWRDITNNSQSSLGSIKSAVASGDTDSNCLMSGVLVAFTHDLARPVLPNLF